MNMINVRVLSAATDQDLPHSAFRLYVVLVAALDGEHRPGFTEISADALRGQVPGVKGKPLSGAVFQENLRTLQRAGLVETSGSTWSKFTVRVRLPVDFGDPEVHPRLKRDLASASPDHEPLRLDS